MVADIVQRARIINDSLELAREGKTFATRLSRCDLLLDHAQHLIQYEQKGIPTDSPVPSQVLAEFRTCRSDLILEEAHRAAEKAKAKASVAASTTAKHNALGGELLKVQEIMETSSDASSSLDIELELKALMHKGKLDGYLEAAKKAEFKGNKKKAIDQYQEALYFIHNDEVPDNQQTQEIKEIESKLRELGES